MDEGARFFSRSAQPRLLKKGPGLATVYRGCFCKTLSRSQNRCFYPIGPVRGSLSRCRSSPGGTPPFLILFSWEVVMRAYRPRAFTLVELLVVIAIIGILDWDLGRPLIASGPGGAGGRPAYSVY
ncbi:MAG: type II secretion system protein [Planctomycetota bacterium]